MTIQELRRTFGELQQTNDENGITHLITDHSELLASYECAAWLMHTLAGLGMTRLVAILFERGVDVNIPEDPRLPDRPISAAVMWNRIDTVRWLLEHGSDVNYGWDGDQDYCVPLSCAIRAGHFEIVRLLVEAGAYLNVLDRTKRTPLTWAIQYGQHEIADYLRSKGAIEAHQVSGYVSPESRNPILGYVADHFGPTKPLALGPIVPDVVPVAIRAATQDGVVCLYTDGMSAQPMNVPPGGNKAFQYAELATYLYNWPEDRDQWLEPEYLWPITWMRRLAQYPFEYDTWLGGQTPIIANGDPPQPLGPNTEMTCWLLLAEKEPLTRFKMPDGRSVFFYEMIPIHTAERDYEREYGIVALLEKFSEEDVPEYLDPKRKSVV